MELPILEDDSARIRLVPFTEADADDMHALTNEPGVVANTYVPSKRGTDFGKQWVGTYISSTKDGTRAGFSIRDRDDDTFLGFVALVRIEQEARQAEAGYVLTQASRGRGAATVALTLLSRWALDALGLQRLELRIATENPASMAVAERCGYKREGVLRSLYFKEGQRGDTAIYSLLPQDAK